MNNIYKYFSLYDNFVNESPQNGLCPVFTVLVKPFVTLLTRYTFVYESMEAPAFRRVKHVSPANASLFY